MKANRLFFYITVIFLFAFSACKKQEVKVEEIVPLEIKKSNHNWYYFTENGFLPVEKPKFVPQTSSIPWTESVRISSANSVVNENGQTNGYAIVNRLGVLTFENDKIDFSKDITLFSERTSGNLVFYDKTPLFSAFICKSPLL